jgi:hypothetical protein
MSEIIRKSTKGTEEYNHERWKKQGERLLKHQAKMSEILSGIFA